MTDDEIIAPGKLVFPHGGWINVHEIHKGQVLYHIRHPSSDIGNHYRKDVADFIACVRREGGVRAT